MITILSLGAGVQSSTLALMAAVGDIPKPDYAVFADTMAEPQSVYRWLDWLERQLPYPVIRVSRGDMTKESLTLREFKNDPSRHWSKNLLPAYIQNQDGSIGLLGRDCTADYKVRVLIKEARRLGGIKRGQKTVGVIQWIGISLDEASRMKPSREPWVEHRWPLIDLEMKRHDCLRWMESHGFPTPPRSACIYCPFHNNSEWRRLRDSEPEEFARAIQFEKDLQAVKAQTDNLKGIPFLHRSMKPLSEADLSTEEERGQLNLFNNECEGMCGV